MMSYSAWLQSRKVAHGVRPHGEAEFLDDRIDILRQGTFQEQAFSLDGAARKHAVHMKPGPAMQDLIGGRIHFLCDLITTAKGKQALADSLEHTNWSTGRDRPIFLTWIALSWQARPGGGDEKLRAS